MTGEAVGGSEAFVSRDGRFAAFHTTYPLVSEDLNGVYDVYRYEVATGAFQLVSRSLSGGAGNDDSFAASISGDGHLAFTSSATDLVEGQQDDLILQLYVADLTTRATRRISESPDGDPGDSWTWQASFDRTGHYLAFQSQAGNLVRSSAARTRASSVPISGRAGSS